MAASDKDSGAPSQQYKAVWPLVCVKDSLGRVGQYYQDAVLPDGIPDDELKRHLEAGAVEAVSS